MVAFLFGVHPTNAYEPSTHALTTHTFENVEAIRHTNSSIHAQIFICHNVVLQHNRNAMQRAPPLPPTPLIVQPPRNAHQLMSRRDTYQRSQLPPPPIMLLNLVEVCFYDFHAGDGARVQHLRQLEGGGDERIESGLESGSFAAGGYEGAFARDMSVDGLEDLGRQFGLEGGGCEGGFERLPHGAASDGIVGAPT
jgi:hypothetical protein